ncbi:MAG: transposase, partial [Dietzia sp.]|nr:transposase [Dietzia sp.]
HSVGFAVTEHIRAAIAAIPKRGVWSPAVNADGEARKKADVAEITGLLPEHVRALWPVGMRVIVRRERPHPGAQLSLFEETDGWRYQAFATNTTLGALQFLEARHRAHARVEDRIRHAKDTGLGRLPSREYAINTAWLATVAIAADLISWLRLLALPEKLAACEPKALRYRLLHVPARITRGGRRRRLRFPKTWPWVQDIVAVFARITAIPRTA